jgi:YHS domain-containing protein
VVSGEKLGGMGDPYVFQYEGTEVRLCCPNCMKEFNKDPKSFIAKIEAARKK